MKIKIGKIQMEAYWVVALLLAVVLLATGQTSLSIVVDALTSDTAINPLKILVLFISMTVLSIYLDELGFFRYLANKTLKGQGRTKRSSSSIFT